MSTLSSSPSLREQLDTSDRIFRITALENRLDLSYTDSGEIVYAENTNAAAGPQVHLKHVRWKALLRGCVLRSAHDKRFSKHPHSENHCVLRNQQRVKQTFRVSCATLNETVSEAPGRSRRRPCGAVFFTFFYFFLTRLSFFVDFLLTFCLLRTTKPTGLSSVTCSKSSELLT